MTMISFDIDGTLEVGDPPGPLSLDLVRAAKRLGYVVGSASDRVISDQRRLWRLHEIEMDFVSHKHHLDQIKRRFKTVTRHIHIGDTHVDRHFAEMHGFEFYFMDGLPADGSPGWVF